MKDSISNKKGADAQISVADQPKRKPAAFCELCGQELERDPESGEYICPVCDYEEIQP